MFVLQSLHQKNPVVLCTTKLAQSTSRCDFAPQRLQKAVWHSPHNTSPFLPFTTNLAQQTPQEYFELKSLHHLFQYCVYLNTPLYDKTYPVLLLYFKLYSQKFPEPVYTRKVRQNTSPWTNPTTTLYHKACTKHGPGFFSLQSFHNPHPGWRKHLPDLLCSTKLAKQVLVLVGNTNDTKSTFWYLFPLQRSEQAPGESRCTPTPAQNKFQY